MEQGGQNLNSQQTRVGVGECAEQVRRPECGFEGALAHIKEGRCVARRGWNGRGIFVFLNKGAVSFKDTDTIPPCIDGIKRSLFDQWAGGIITRTPNISIQSASGSRTEGWAPSQTDMLAEDWYIF